MFYKKFRQCSNAKQLNNFTQNDQHNEYQGSITLKMWNHS
jgi:hypothetical protein